MTRRLERAGVEIDPTVPARVRGDWHLISPDGQASILAAAAAGRPAALAGAVEAVGQGGEWARWELRCAGHGRSAKRPR